MSIAPTNNAEPQNPTSAQYPLRPAGRSSPFRINVIKSLRLHTVTSVLVTLLTLGLGLAVVARHKPTYKAASIIYVSPTVPKTLVDDRELERPYESYIQETVHAVSRYDIVEEALHRLPPGLWSNPGENEHASVQRLQESLEINRIAGTYQVEIAINGGRPEHLAEIVNTVTAVYLEKAKNEEFYGRGDRVNTLKTERTKIQADIDADLKEQSGLTKSLGVANISAKATSNVIDEGNAKVQTDLQTAHEQTIEAQAKLNALKAGDSSSPNSPLSIAADESIASDPSLMALKTSLSQKRAEAIIKLDGMTPANPAYKATQDQIAQIEKQLNEMQTNKRRDAGIRLEQKLRSDLSRAQMVESKLMGDLQHGTAQANEAAPRIQRAEAIQTDLDRLQGRLGVVDDRISNLELESSSPGSVHLFSPAMVPLGPEKSKIALLVVILFPMAIFMGIATALALDFLDPHIYTASDVEALLGFAPIGMLFDDREVTQIAFDECALRLAAGIDHAARSSNARTFVLTGVNSGAGTTSIIENLGSMLAKLGRKTMVIDPSGNNEPVAFVSYGQALQRQSVGFGENALPAPASTEITHSNRSRQNLPMKAAPINSFVFESFQNMSADYDIVLIDAAPILISAETEYLARMADVTVLIAEAGKTKKAWLTRAARLLERLGVGGAAAAVNKVNPARVEESIKQDLRDFEVRNDKVNMQDWWKPGKKSSPDEGRAPQTADPLRDKEEDVIYARDI